MRFRRRERRAARPEMRRQWPDRARVASCRICHQCREHGREVAAVRRERRRGHGKARLAQRRIPVAAKIVIEAPVQQGPAHKFDVAEAPGIAQRAKRSFRGEQTRCRARACGRRRRSRLRADPCVQARVSGRCAAVIDERLFLDLRLEAKRCRGRAPGRRPRSRRNARRRPRRRSRSSIVRVLSVSDPRPTDSLIRAGLLTLPLARPQRGLHSAFGRELARERARRRGLQQLQCAIEVGLADAVGADEDGELADGKADGAQRAITGNAHLADFHALVR